MSYRNLILVTPFIFSTVRAMNPDQACIEQAETLIDRTALVDRTVQNYTARVQEIIIKSQDLITQAQQLEVKYKNIEMQAEHLEEQITNHEAQIIAAIGLINRWHEQEEKCECTLF
jgi:hypothetical protein